MATESVGNREASGLAAIRVRIGVGLYTVYRFAFTVLPLAVKTQARVTDRFQEQAVSEGANPVIPMMAFQLSTAPMRARQCLDLKDRATVRLD